MQAYMHAYIPGQCIIRGGAGTNIDSVRRKPYNWIPDSAWLACMQLYMRIPLFKDLPESMQRYGDQWRAWFESEVPEEVPTPEVTSCGAKPTKLSMLMIARALRPDRLPVAALDFVKSVFGDKIDATAPLQLELVVAESVERTPLLCIVTPGADLSDAIHALGKKLKKEVFWKCVPPVCLFV